MHTYRYIYIYTHTQTRTHTQNARTDIYLRAHTCPLAHSQLPVHTHTHVSARTYTHTHTHTLTQTHTHTDTQTHTHTHYQADEARRDTCREHLEPELWHVLHSALPPTISELYMHTHTHIHIHIYYIQHHVYMRIYACRARALAHSS